jgi:hypothetical protein
MIVAKNSLYAGASGWILCVCLSLIAARAEDQTFDYTVQISAVVQTNPPRITLSWPADIYGANSYTVYRKTKSATSWGTGTLLPGSFTSYVDTNVSVGSAYEYRIYEPSSIGHNCYGYIYAGINAPLTESRGKVILVVATNSALGLDSELQRLQSDLVGDGWSVIRHDVSSNDTPAFVKSFIVADYNADPSNVSALFLFGHVPIFHTGNLNYDGHQARPMPSDSYYGDVNGSWTTNTDYLPSDVELMVGRVDFFDMPGNGALVPFPNETELLRNYLNKDHKWRHKIITAPRRALMGNNRGDEGGEATAATGYRNFAPLCGTPNLTEANVDGINGGTNRWICYLSTNVYLWAYGNGGGLANALGGLGTNFYGDGSYWLFSTEVVGVDAKAVFAMVFGSWMGNFDDEDDFIRSFIAVPTYGLASCMAGRPHWFLHHMGLGETIGYSTRLSMNNSTLYQNHSNYMIRAIYVALMGDPTLRQDIVAPVSNLSALAGANSVTLNWSPSSDPVLGYHVYRATSPSGPFTRLTSNLVTSTSYSDASLAANTYTYMVRAVALQTTPSGTFFNPSQGQFSNATVPGVPAITVVAQRSNNNLTLTWNSQSGTSYHVQYKDGFLQPYWSNLSGTISATGAVSSWTDTNIAARTQRLYRVTTP